MKKILLILAAIFMLPCANAAPEFKEGVNYDVLKQTATAQPEVLEFFLTTALHVRNLNPLLSS